MLSRLPGLVPLLIVAVCLLAPVSYICHKIGVPWYVRFLLAIGLWFISLCVLPRQLPTYTGPDEDDVVGGPCCRKPNGPCPCATRKRWVGPINDEARSRFRVVCDDPADPDGPHELPSLQRQMLGPAGVPKHFIDITCPICGQEKSYQDHDGRFCKPCRDNARGEGPVLHQLGEPYPLPRSSSDPVDEFPW